MKLKIEQLIKSSGFKKNFIAEKLNVSRRTLDNWISGKTDIPLRKAIELTNILRCDLNELWEEEDI